MDLTAVYNEVFSMEKDQVELLKEDLVKRYHTAESTFDSAPEEDRKFLKLFSFICLLSFDVYTKKMLIEQLVDELRDENNEEFTKSKKSKK